MDATTAGRSARALELLHSLIYFVPETETNLVSVGLSPGRMCYFAGRAAPMGHVTAGVVAATFYNFNIEQISPLIPQAWSQASPDAITAAKYNALTEAFTRILGADVVSSREMSEAAELASIAARAIPSGEGRPLYSAYAELEWPSASHLVLWHALTLLREHRGDGHIAALQTAQLSGVEALITHTATGVGFEKEFARKRRGWSDQQWNDACAGLRDQEILDDVGDLTDDGRALRQVVEDITNDLALAPWNALGDEGSERLVELGTPWRDTAVRQGVFPAGVFGPRVSS